jgi:hypothetical protein
MKSRPPPDIPAGGDSHKALARRHQRLVKRYAPLMAGLLLTGSFALFVFTETYFGQSSSSSSYRRYDRRDRDDGIFRAVAHAVMGAFRAMRASDFTVCVVFAVIALGAFLGLGWICLMLWLKRPVSPRGGAR